MIVNRNRTTEASRQKLHCPSDSIRAKFGVSAKFYSEVGVLSELWGAVRTVNQQKGRVAAEDIANDYKC